MQLKGPALVMLAAFLWGVSGGIGGLLMTHGWSPLVVTFYRGAVGLACILLWWALHRLAGGSQRVGGRHHWPWSVLAGLGVAGNLTFYAIAIDRTSVAVAATLMYTAPIYVLLAAFLAGRERADWGKAAAIALVLLGVALLTGLLDGGASDITAVGVAAGIASALSYTLFILAFQNAAARGTVPTTLAIAFATFVIVLALLVDRTRVMAALHSADLGGFLLLGFFGVGLSFAVYLPGLRRTPASLASMIAMVEPVTASLFGLLVLGETLGLSQWLGMAMIVITVTTLSVRRH
ncbi:DMT family transporter [Modicisalibacter radicis]|uniref:DMT family transporter n=1 Tax=Halomonas sp. EAR18 TaxID=2518972 RepID=UPI00109CA53D|nr:DMT family transporter [Halomonas sp. EAR18]